jgi:hypothetical protein
MHVFDQIGISRAIEKPGFRAARLDRGVCNCPEIENQVSISERRGLSRKSALMLKYALDYLGALADA